MTTADNNSPQGGHPRILDWPLAILCSIALHTLILSLFFFPPTPAPQLDLIEISLVLDVPDPKPSVASQKTVPVPAARPKKPEPAEAVQPEVPKSTDRKIPKVPTPPHTPPRRAPDIAKPPIKKSQPEAEAKTKAKAKSVTVTKTTTLVKVPSAQQNTPKSADTDVPKSIAETTPKVPAKPATLPRIAPERKTPLVNQTKTSQKTKENTQTKDKIAAKTAPPVKRVRLRSKRKPEVDRRAVHRRVPYIDRSVKPAAAAAIRAIRAHEPRLVREDKGQNVARDERYRQAAALAVARYERAAGQGYVMAQYNLGRALAEGRGVPRDYKKAVEFFRNAAQQGNVPAMPRLAEMHLAGLGTPENRVEAHALYNVAASIGNKGALLAKIILAAHLDNNQLGQARERARALRALMPPMDLGQQRRGELDLQAAAAKGDLRAVNSSMKSGVDANATDEEGRTALIVAAWRGHINVLRTLLDAGVDIDAADNKGRTALSWAAINGFPDLIKTLLGETALVDVRDSEGLTPLIRAAWNGHEGIVADLIDGNANIHINDDYGFTALRRAEAQNEVGIAAMLRAAAKKDDAGQ